ncbi:MAG: c-type cytochrome [Planctomycetota bacterium]|nr:c-type cytochrome [Planctomycetota bacterium]
MSSSTRFGCALLVLAIAVALGGFPTRTQALEPGPSPQWIWNSPFPDAVDREWFSKRFQLTRLPQSATLWLLADDKAEARINEVSVATVVGTRRIQPVDVTGKFREGENRIDVICDNDAGPAGIALWLKLTDEQGRSTVITSDPTWTVRKRHTQGDREYATSLGLLGVFPWGNPEGETEDYYQWKKALGAGQAHDAASIAVMPGFEVDLVHSSAKGEGSWVSLTFDPQGRAIIGREGKGLLRYSLPPFEKMEIINDTLEECRGVLYAGRSLFANANNSKGLYRLRDTDGDDRFDEVKLLKQTGGGVGHGRNGLALGPDGMIYTIHGNNVRLPEDYKPGRSPLQHLAEDKLIPVDWDRFLFDADAKVPAGHVARIDPEGDNWELVAGGFRNPYGIDFNADGEMFTFDADNEGDIGTPWYRPTRINHIVSGGDYGFRQGTANRLAHFAEHLPANVDIGLGSPTGVKFGTHSSFPGRYRQALYALDWSYGRIYAVHLLPRVAGYVCTVEKLLEGSPLNVTDLAFGPDGAMYFVTGGRGTQSGLYRVQWGREAEIGLPMVLEDPNPLWPGIRHQLKEAEDAQQCRRLRRQLESFHGRQDPAAVELAWKHLGNPDPWLRHAARVALEFQPVVEWSDTVFNGPFEGDYARPDRFGNHGELDGLLALARVGEPKLRSRLLDKLSKGRFDSQGWHRLDFEERLEILRILSICVTRMGRPDAKSCADWAQRLERLYPKAEFEREIHTLPLLKQRLCELLVYFDSPTVVAKTMPLVEQAESAEDRLRYLFLLRTAKQGWTPALRRQYFELLKSLDYHTGGNLLPVALDALRNEVLATLTDAERLELEALFARDDREAAAAADLLKQRPVVKKWGVADLEATLKNPGRPSFEAGERLFRQGLCVRCHRVAGAGGAVGPELSKVANRFGPRDLLEMILDPSKSIDEKYRQTQVETKAGKVITGRLVGGDDKSLLLAPDALAPRTTTRIAKDEIESQSVSNTSPMPAGLLDSFTPDEIRDLLAYLRAGGSRDHGVYRDASTTQ